MNHLFLFTFVIKNDYNSRIIKLCLFLNNISLSLAVNTLFFNDSTMHQIFEDKGSFNFIYQLPQILYSSLIAVVIKTLLKFVSLTEKNVLEIKNKKNYKSANKKIKKFLKSVKIKFIIFHSLNTLFLIIFWYYTSCFCAVYNKTQITLVKDTLISYVTSNIYPFFISIFPGIFRIISLKGKKEKEIMYKLSKILALI